MVQDNDPSQQSARAVADGARLAALDACAILDTEEEAGFDDVTLLAAQLCGMPTALVSLVTADRQWFKARIGFDAAETPLSHSVCRFAIGRPGLLVVPDLTLDSRTRDNPLVTGAPHMRFYAGARLETPAGQALGTLCVIDAVPRPAGLSPVEARGLEALARQVMALIEGRRVVAARNALVVEKRAGEQRLPLSVAVARLGTYRWFRATGDVVLDGRSREIFGFGPDEPVDVSAVLSRLHPDDLRRVSGEVKASRRDGTRLETEYRIVTPARGERIVHSMSVFTTGPEGSRDVMIGACSDVTERRALEGSLRRPF